jgi:hypothetical protein
MKHPVSRPKRRDELGSVQLPPATPQPRTRVRVTQSGSTVPTSHRPGSPRAPKERRPTLGSCQYGMRAYLVGQGERTCRLRADTRHRRASTGAAAEAAAAAAISRPIRLNPTNTARQVMLAPAACCLNDQVRGSTLSNTSDTSYKPVLNRTDPKKIWAPAQIVRS